MLNTFCGSHESYICIDHQLGFSASEAIHTAELYEKIFLHYGIMFNMYPSDNGVFKFKTFIQHATCHTQRTIFGGVNARHQNGEAEKTIHTVSDIDRAMMRHISIK